MATPSDLPASVASFKNCRDHVRDLRKTGTRGSRTLPPLSLTANVAWVFAGNISFALSRLILLVALIKLGGLEAAGVWIAATTLCGPIFTGAELGLRNLLVCDVSRMFLFQDYLSLRTVAAGLALVVTLTLALSLNGFTGAAAVVMMVACARLFDALSDICHGVLQREERMDCIGFGLFLRHGIGLLGILTGLALGGGVLLAAAADTFAALLAFFLWNLPSTARLLRGLSVVDSDETARREAVKEGPLAGELIAWQKPRREWLTMLWQSLPAGIVVFEISLMTNLPRMIVDAYLGKEALTIFASVLQIAAVGMVFISALANAFVPRLARYYHGRRLSDYMKLLVIFTGMTLALGLIPWILVSLPLGQRLIGWVFTPEFVRDPSALRWLALSACLLYLTSPLGRAVDSLMQFRAHMIIRAVMLVMITLFVPAWSAGYGMRGAAIGMALSLATGLPLYLGVIMLTWRKALTCPADTIRETRNGQPMRCAA